MRKIIIVFSGCCLALLLTYVSYRGYGVWKQKHWMTMAREFAAKGDLHNEFLSLEKVLQANSRNLEASRMIAILADAQHSETALRWRKRVLELDPDSLDNHLALAQTAIFFRQFDLVAGTLANIDGAGKKTPGYYSVAGELALALQHLDEAQADFAEASRLDPSNPALQMNLAVVELHRTNDLDASEGRIALKRLSLNSTNIFIRTRAKRELVMDAIRFKDFSVALALSTELAQATNAPFDDKLLRLDSLLAGQMSELSSVLVSYERESAADPAKIGPLALWLMGRDRHAQALSWLRSLPLQIQTNRPANLLMAQCQMLDRDWSGLQNSISKQDWAELNFTRHAYIARAVREQGLAGASKAEWEVTLKSAKNQLEPLKSLFAMTVQWQWPNEAQQVLWAVVNSYPKEQWAGAELAAELFRAGATRPLMQFFSTEYNRNQADLEAENNLAATAMLLHATEIRPYDLARDVFQKAPTNAAFACTYAYSLHLQGQKENALKTMQSIAPKDLDSGATAGYYGVILTAVGERSKAGPFLRRAISGPLLPEERDLFQHALMGL